MGELYLHGAFALGGGLGAVLRHWLSRAITHDLPLATLFVNILGSFILGAWIALLSADASLTEQERRLVFGFCGGFTTFSSFAYQSLQLHRERTLIHAAGNILLSFAGCVLAFWLGLQLMPVLGL